MAGTDIRLPGFLSSLSARLLVLTIFFVMLAEFLIWAPSVSNFRRAYLEEQLAHGHLSTLAFEVLPTSVINRHLEEVLLKHTDAYSIVLKGPDRRALMVSTERPPEIDKTIDLREKSFLHSIGAAFETLAQDQNRVLRVNGMTPKIPNIVIEIIMDETPMREAMYEFSSTILQLSLGISFFTAFLVYVSLQWLMVRPVQRITRSIQDFRKAPEDATHVLRPSHRTDEIGMTERELAKMQDELRQSLQQQSRLATLGAAVAKINHDLRNSLATAVLAFDKLATINDPEVKSVLPRMYNAIDKAVRLCSQTLNYVGDLTPSLKTSRFHLQEVIAEAAAAFREADERGRHLKIRNQVAFEIEVTADRVQLFRVYSNLFQNALEADAETITVTAVCENKRNIIEIADDGPGFTERAREHIFEPFTGSTKDGGTGLGLIIVRDAIKAHGGDIELLPEHPGKGAVFRMTLPGRRA